MLRPTLCSLALQCSQGRSGLVFLKRPPPCRIPRSGFVSSSVTKQTEDLNGSTSKSIFFGWTGSEEADQRGWKGLRGWLITAGTWGFGVGMEGEWGLLAAVCGGFPPTPAQGQFQAPLWISAALSSSCKQDHVRLLSMVLLDHVWYLGHSSYRLRCQPVGTSPPGPYLPHGTSAYACSWTPRAQNSTRGLLGSSGFLGLNPSGISVLQMSPSTVYKEILPRAKAWFKNSFLPGNH